ncbi:MAG: DNA mismatch endonuclease Vsr [Bacteroidota bacterium]
MADNHSKEIRSFNMSRIRSKNTKPELLVRKFLFSNGFRYRLHDKKLPGKPDIVMPKYKTVIFVHGCFWHGHENCVKSSIPKTRTDWWFNKINLNKINDLKHQRSLIESGWRVIYIWTCQLNKLTFSETLNRCIKELKR